MDYRGHYLSVEPKFSQWDYFVFWMNRNMWVYTVIGIAAMLGLIFLVWYFTEDKLGDTLSGFICMMIFLGCSVALIWGSAAIKDKNDAAIAPIAPAIPTINIAEIIESQMEHSTPKPFMTMVTPYN